MMHCQILQTHKKLEPHIRKLIKINTFLKWVLSLLPFSLIKIENKQLSFTRFCVNQWRNVEIETRRVILIRSGNSLNLSCLLRLYAGHWMGDAVINLFIQCASLELE